MEHKSPNSHVHILAVICQYIGKLCISGWYTQDYMLAPIAPDGAEEMGISHFGKCF